MVLDIEKDLKNLSGVARVRIVFMMIKVVTGNTPKTISEIHEGLVGNILIKSGGGKKGGRRLGANLRRKVIAHLKNGGTVTMTVLAEGDNQHG